MGKTHDCISEDLVQWIREQRVFFVATASRRGHVNVSPKGHVQGCFAVLSPRRVAYLDFTGSGAETAAHLLENGRITVLFVAFTGPPQILRLYGTGTAVPRAAVAGELCGSFAEEYVGHTGFRAVIIVDVTRVSTSCGFSIPFFDHVGERDTLLKSFAKKTPEEADDYRLLKNSFSIDLLPSIAHRAAAGSAAPLVVARPASGYWFAYADLSAAETARSYLQLLLRKSPLDGRDLAMLGLGAASAALALGCWARRAARAAEA